MQYPCKELHCRCRVLSKGKSTSRIAVPLSVEYLSRYVNLRWSYEMDIGDIA